MKSNMRINLWPLGDRVVVEPTAADDHTTSGLFLPETAKEKPQKGKIVATGPGNRNEKGERIPLDIKVEDTVLYAKYGGTMIKLDGREYLILKEADVLAIFENGHK